MCLSIAYEVKDGAETMVMDKVMNVAIEPDRVVLTNLLGINAEVMGSLKSIDLNRNIILIESK